MEFTFLLCTSFLTAIAAIVAPIATAKIQSKKEKELKLLELTFETSINVFKDITEKYATLTGTANYKNTMMLCSSISSAIIIVKSNKTKKLLMSFSESVRQKCLRTVETDKAYSECLLALSDELNQSMPK